MVVFVLRHADRDPAADALSAGRREARQVSRAYAGRQWSKPSLCSDAQRTHHTLAPLKQALGDRLSITEFSAAASGGLDGHVQAVVAAIAALPATAVAIAVSHSNTVGPIIEGLGGGIIAPIGEAEFDRLFVLFIPPNDKKTLLQLRY